MAIFNTVYGGKWTIPKSWLLWYRPLQENLNDESWNWKNGSWYSWTGSFWTVWSKKWAIVTLDANERTSQHIVTTLNNSWPTLTICWWIYLNSYATSSFAWIMTNSSSTTSYVVLWTRPWQSNKWTVWGYNNLLTVNSTPSLSTWYFVVWVLTSSWKEIYVNWTLAGSDTTWFTTGQWTIWRLGCGQIGDWATRWWTNGYIRHCAVYNRVLSADEMQKYYDITK